MTRVILETAAERDAWAEEADEPFYFMFAGGQPYVLFITEDGDWFATRPPYDDDRRDDGTYPGGVTEALESVLLPILIAQDES